MTSKAAFPLRGLIICCSFLFVSGCRILISSPYGTKSHQNMFVPLVKELVKRGHHVTIITNYPLVEEIQLMENVRGIILEDLLIHLNSSKVFDMLLTSSGRLDLLQETVNSLLDMPIMATDKMYRTIAVQTLIREEHFDLVIISQWLLIASLPMAWHFKAPIIAISPNGIDPGLATVLGDGGHYSYVPFFLTSFSDQMTFSQRFINLVASEFWDFILNRYPRSTVLSIVRKEILPDCPPLEEIEKNISLVFTNTHPTFSYPRALPPQVIEIGGTQCRPVRPLPQDLEDFVSSSDEGFILFAVGSAMQVDIMPEYIIQAFIRTFVNLPQRVIWQWSGTPRNDLPENVLQIPWVPQQDLLGHSGCRVFITHGGIGSVQEAVYHGVPILGLPFVSDQTINIRRATRHGYALLLDWKDVTEESVTSAIQELLHNSKFQKAADIVSELFRHQTKSPLERAVYWTEFAIRHKGADHLRLGSRHLSPFQRSLMDVYIVILLACLVIPLSLIILCKRIRGGLPVDARMYRSRQ